MLNNQFREIIGQTLFEPEVLANMEKQESALKERLSLMGQLHENIVPKPLEEIIREQSSSNHSK